MDREYFQYRVADVLCQLLPRGLAYWIGLRVADGFYRHDTHGRECVRTNLRRILEHQGQTVTDDVLSGMARDTFRHFGKYLVDFFRFSQCSPERIREVIVEECGNFVHEAESFGKGVLAVTAHLGSWELGAASVAAMGRPLNVVFLPQKSQKTNRLFRRRRESRGEKVIPLGHAAKGTLRALRRNEWVAVLADRDYGPHKEDTMFFGAPAPLPTGPARLCVRSGAPMLPGFVLRRADDSYVLRWHEPIVPASSTGVEVVHKELVRVMERAISASPTQWFMFEDFWHGHGFSGSGT